MINTLFLTNLVLGNYILTTHYAEDMMTPYAEAHGGTLIATVDHLSFYKVSDENYNKHYNILESSFDVEKEVEFSIGEAVFIQTPGQMFFEIREQVPWHLDRISKEDLPLDGTFNHPNCLSNPNVTVNTYIVDTGIDVKHPEFEGRATWLNNFTEDGDDFDGHGHGTHCAGLVGSLTYGVCKDANLFAVKVLDAEGSGSMSGVLGGLDFIFKRHKAQDENVRSIVSMSLGGGYSKALNRAIETMLKTSDTFYVVAAAGNEDADACGTSPASAKGVITIMASDITDGRAYFSNYGKCADIYSPGVNIVSTMPGESTARMSGTSMATPIFAGVVNHYLSKSPELVNSKIKKAILRDATAGTISGNPENTNNLFVYLE